MRIAVVGAGVGGLAAAVRLAGLGHRVTVFEQAPTVGGKLGRFARDGFLFDTGPSLVTLPHVFADLLPELELRRLDPIVRHRFPDGSVLDSGDGFAERIGDAFGRSAAEDWQRLWRRAARVWESSWRHVLSVPLESPLSIARQGWRLPDLLAVAPGGTLRGLGRRMLRDPRLRMLLDRYATYAGADPRRAPAALVAIAYAELHYGGWYVPGGLGRIADALLARAEAAGVTVHTGVSVTGIRPLVADGVRIPTDAVVANADATHVYRDLLPTPSRLARLNDRSLAGFVLLMGVRGTTPGLAHHNVFFPHDYDAEFDAVFGTPTRRPRPAADPTVFVTAPDDDAVRPAGHEGWFVLVNAAPQSTVDWTVPGTAERYADRVLDVLAARGVDVRERVAFREVRTPADLARATNAPGGTIYGTAGSLLRPPNRGPAPGVFLVGGSVHPGGGLPMVLLSARHVAELIGPA
ncbi:phytoene desaturase [Virgisporangium aliadipatigenens]|uniref:Phytoene desaturase n=1 Tax=Virgisporangium aliadipatigenens TaxID=741659 RepID=A0A8J3YQC4_9ACTN|nr:phytoene desaturase family protein [Virgisporangium aliadipatigenens]GIJ49864.1 phytoene desaturase [Virgisporangium aliadipatigenens]